MRNSLALIITVLLAAWLLPSSLSAQETWQIQALGGVFSPSNDEIQNIYGDAVTGALSIAAPLGKAGRIRFGVDRFQRSGDPFFRSADFDAGETAKLTLTAISVGLETYAPKAGQTRVNFGAGIDYVFGTERIPRQETSDGRAIAAHVAVTPEIKISRNISLLAQASYRFLEMTFKNGRERYRFNLSGARLLAGVAFTFQ